MGSIKVWYMVSKRRRNKSLISILHSLISVFKSKWVIMEIVDRRLVFNYFVPDDSVTIDKL